MELVKPPFLKNNCPNIYRKEPSPPQTSNCDDQPRHRLSTPYIFLDSHTLSLSHPTQPFLRFPQVAPIYTYRSESSVEEADEKTWKDQKDKHGDIKNSVNKHIFKIIQSPTNLCFLHIQSKQIKWLYHKTSTYNPRRRTPRALLKKSGFIHVSTVVDSK